MASTTLSPATLRIRSSDNRTLLDISQRRYCRLATVQGSVIVPERSNVTIDETTSLGAVPTGAKFALVMARLYELGGQERYGYSLCINGSYLVTASHGRSIQHSFDTFGDDQNFGERDYYWADRYYRPFAHLAANIYQLWHFKIVGDELQFREQSQTLASPEPNLYSVYWRGRLWRARTTMPGRVTPFITGTDIRYTAYIMG